MKVVHVATDNAIKFAEIAEMLALYGCNAVQTPSDGTNRKEMLAQEPPAPPDAVVREQTSLRQLSDGRVEHQSLLTVCYPDRISPLSGAAEGSRHTWIERVRGRLRENAPTRDGAYDWDSKFVPSGSHLTLDGLKRRGLKVSARQLAVGAWLQEWLHYPEPTTWKHMRPTDRVDEWLAGQAILQTPKAAPTRAIIERVHQSGAWFKASENRRVKHYWWPGLNAGVPMTPKKDYVHELTFLVHDLIHWAMPDTVPAADTEMDHRLYVATRMMSEAITLVMADMAFIDQAIADGLEYDTQKRKIHPLYSPEHSLVDWCRAMSHYAIRGDDSKLAKIASSPEALAAFKDKYAPFFEEDLRWTAHNARHLTQSLDPRWIALHAEFAQNCDLRLTSTADYHDAWSENDEQLVDRVFDRLWSIHWADGDASQGRALDPSIEPETRRLQRCWLGQIALTHKMDDLPLSRVVREAIVRACFEAPTTAKLAALIPLWDNYVDALEGLSRISGNDNSIFKTYYPVVPPLYVSYDMGRDAYQGIAAMWAQAREKNNG